MKLFQPDNFSRAEISFKEYGGDFKPFLKILEKYFDEFEIKNIYQVDRAEIQTQNYKIVLQRHSEEKIILLKKYKVSPDLEQINFYLNLLVLLAEKGVLVSSVLKTLDGELTTVVEGDIYSAFDFIAGNHFSPSDSGFADVATNMAKMHNAFNQLGGQSLSQIDVFSQKGYYPFNVVKNYSVEDFLAVEEKIRSKSEKKEGEEILLEKLPVFKDAVAEVKTYEKRILGLPKQIIHSDFHPHNVLVDGDKIKAILDFENVRMSQQVRDAGFAIYKFGRQFFANSGFNNVSQEASRLKDLFIDNYVKVRPMSVEEIELLPVLTKDSFIRKLLFVLKGVYEEGNFIWINDLPKHIVAIDEINCFWPKNNG